MSLAVATNCIGQSFDSTKYIVAKYVVENNSVTYITAYELPAKLERESKDLVINKTSEDSRLSILQASISENQISGSFEDLEINFKRFGYNLANVTIWTIHPVSADFAIQFNDNKYRAM